MKKSRFAKEQIIDLLMQADQEMCRTGGFSEATLQKWRVEFSRMQVSETQRLRELKSENAKLKRLLIEARLERHALKSVLGSRR